MRQVMLYFLSRSPNCLTSVVSVYHSAIIQLKVSDRSSQQSQPLNLSCSSTIFPQDWPRFPQEPMHSSQILQNNRFVMCYHYLDNRTGQGACSMTWSATLPIRSVFRALWPLDPIMIRSYFSWSAMFIIVSTGDPTSILDEAEIPSVTAFFLHSSGISMQADFCFSTSAELAVWGMLTTYRKVSVDADFFANFIAWDTTPAMWGEPSTGTRIF